jgi:hypothetical protein
MPTTRTPVNRPPRRQITPHAVKIFAAMKAIECTCEPRDWDGAYWEHQPCAGCAEWWDLHSFLHNELKCRPWEWPCIEHPDAKSPYPENSHADRRWKPDTEAQARWRLLEEAA